LTIVFFLILLSMNEVNIKYWFRNFEKKNFFLSIFWTNLNFLSMKNRLVRKKNSVTCRSLPRKVWLPTSTLPVQLKNFSFWISEWLQLNRGEAAIILRRNFEKKKNCYNPTQLPYSWGFRISIKLKVDDHWSDIIWRNFKMWII
jgi:hypothetical protein